MKELAIFNEIIPQAILITLACIVAIAQYLDYLRGQKLIAKSKAEAKQRRLQEEKRRKELARFGFDENDPTPQN